LAVTTIRTAEIRVDVVGIPPLDEEVVLVCQVLPCQIKAIRSISSIALPMLQFESHRSEGLTNANYKRNARWGFQGPFKSSIVGQAHDVTGVLY
jgi:hypothetical protein